MTIIVVLYILCILHTINLCMGEEAVRKTLDIGSPDPTAFQCINCHIDSVPTMLFVAQEGTAIGMVVVDGTLLWSGANCPLVLLHYHDERPVFLRLFTELSYKIANNLYQKVGKEWKQIENDTKMVSLRHTLKTTIGLIVDINYPPSSIKDVRASWCGLDAQILIPKCLHYAKEVCFSSEPIWKPKKDGEKCVLIIICMEYGLPITVHLIINNKFNSMKNLYFVREGLFKECTREVYYNKLVVVRKDACKSIDWAGCV